MDQWYIVIAAVSFIIGLFVGALSNTPSRGHKPASRNHDA